MVPCLPEATQAAKELTCHALQIPWYHIPVGIFSVAAALAAVVMAAKDDAGRGWKGFWLVLIFAFTAAELRMIIWSDSDAKNERDYSTCELQKNFQTTQKENQKDLDQTMCQVNQVFGKTKEAADTATKAVNEITGGNSFAYVIPSTKVNGELENQRGFSLLVTNNGGQILSGVSVSVSLAKWISSAGRTVIDDGIMHPISIGALAAHETKLLPGRLISATDEFTNDAAKYLISVSAQNGTVQEELDFRLHADGAGWDYKARITKTIDSKEVTLKSIDWTYSSPFQSEQMILNPNYPRRR